MNDDLISVILPIYNVEPYIHKSIQSVLSQTYKNLQIILVDDGSPDGCPAICDEYAKKDKRIKVIHKKNGGLSDARNAGLKVAKGKYIAFLDSDDWIDPDMYSLLHEKLVENDCDIAQCNFRKISDKSITIPKQSEDKIYTKEEYLKKLFADEFENFVWNKLYKAELFKDFNFPPIRAFEDVTFTPKVINKTEKIIYINECKYNYLIRNDSLSTDMNIKQRYFCMKAFLDRFEQYYNLYPELTDLLFFRVIKWYIPEIAKNITCSLNRRSEYMILLKLISDFLRNYRPIILNEAKLSHLQKRAVQSFSKGTISGARKSLHFCNLIKIRNKLCKN